MWVDVAHFVSSFICILKIHSRDRSHSQMRVQVDHCIQDSYELGISVRWVVFRVQWPELSRVGRQGDAA
jgi:hypothetical protein